MPLCMHHKRTSALALRREREVCDEVGALALPRYCWKQHEQSVCPTSSDQSLPPALV